MSSGDHDSQRRDSMMSQLQEIFAPPTAESLSKKCLAGIVSPFPLLHYAWFSHQLEDLRSKRALVQTASQSSLQPVLVLGGMIPVGVNLDPIAMIIAMLAIAPREIDLFATAVLLVFT